MTAIQRQRVSWTGFPGAPGLSTFYFLDAASAQSALHAFFAARSTDMPGDVHILLETGGDTIESTTGKITGSWNGSLQTEVVGTQQGSYSSPVGAVVHWKTPNVTDGRRVKGTTFIVPLMPAMYGLDGRLTDAARNSVAVAAASLVTAQLNNFVVWSRPRLARVAYTDGRGIPHKAVVGRNGEAAPVTGSSVPSLAAVLTSRRD